MDRFIDERADCFLNALVDLKSNMDRFIALPVDDYLTFFEEFKIQYG